MHLWFIAVAKYELVIFYKIFYWPAVGSGYMYEISVKSVSVLDCCICLVQVLISTIYN